MTQPLIDHYHIPHTAEDHARALQAIPLAMVRNGTGRNYAGREVAVMELTAEAYPGVNIPFPMLIVTPEAAAALIESVLHAFDSIDQRAAVKAARIEVRRAMTQPSACRIHPHPDRPAGGPDDGR